MKASSRSLPFLAIFCLGVEADIGVSGESLHDRDFAPDARSGSETQWGWMKPTAWKSQPNGWESADYLAAAVLSAGALSMPLAVMLCGSNSSERRSSGSARSYCPAKANDKPRFA